MYVSAVGFTTDSSMRPQIPESQEERIERVYRQAGYSSKGELVRDAVLKLLNDLEAEHHAEEQDVRDAFEYRILQTSSGPEYRLSTRTDSPLRFKYVNKGNPPHTTILDTGTTWIGEGTITEAIAEIDGIEKSSVLTKGIISARVDPSNTKPLTDGEQDLLSEIYAVLDDLISEANQRVLEGKETREEAYKKAVREK